MSFPSPPSSFVVVVLNLYYVPMLFPHATILTRCCRYELLLHLVIALFLHAHVHFPAFHCPDCSTLATPLSLSLTPPCPFLRTSLLRLRLRPSSYSRAFTIFVIVQASKAFSLFLIKETFVPILVGRNPIRANLPRISASPHRGYEPRV